MVQFRVRQLDDETAGPAQALLERLRPCGFERGLELAVLAQTGSRVLVALCDDGVAGLVRWWESDGIAWFDLLAAAVPGAGRELVRSAGRAAQDAGLRLARTRVPEDSVLPGYFGRLGYGPISRERAEDGATWLVLERRLPLLTVREQRRGDASAIGALTGDDPWIYEQGVRPGAFVLSDGDLVAGFVAVREGGRGVAELRPPALTAGYQGRGLELWMLERAVLYAVTNGYVSARVSATAELARLGRDLEDRRWSREGDAFVKRLSGERVLLEEPAWQ